VSNLKIILATAIAAVSVPAYSQQVINCASDDGNRHTCSADVRGGVQLMNQRSGSACQRGYSWGTDPDGVWVDHGCRADFTINAFNPYPNPQRGSAGTINCSSDDGGRHTCSADVRGGVELANQRSGSACQQGYSWGTDQNGIWVDHGCRADFAIRPYNLYANQAGRAGTINCSSDDGGRHNCPADTNGGVLLVEQRSGSPCTRGYSWGEDRDSIWVDHGCRADFQTGNSGGGGYPTAALITCSSDDNDRHSCAAYTNGGVRLVRQISGAACKRGYSWGSDERGIWVDHGCRGEFQVGGGRR
jgi:hypothetical protein